MELEKILGTELYNTVIEKLGDKKILIEDENNQYIPKNRFDEINNQKKELKEQVNELNEKIKKSNVTLEELTKSAENNTELKNKLEELQKSNKEIQNNYEKAIKEKEEKWRKTEIDNKKSFSVRESLLKNNLGDNYLNLVMKDIDLNKITMNEDGTFNGIDDVVKTVKEQYKPLFGEDVVIGTNPNKNTNIDNKQYTIEKIQNMSSDEINKHWNEPEFQEVLKNM